MGGEPTFVSIDDMDGAEWNITALGAGEAASGGGLVRRLKKRFAPGALLHFGQGKWYPGESLPRWALGCWWRRDGVPIWHDESLIADETKDYGHGGDEASRFIQALAEALGVNGDHVIPAYEDVWHYLMAERRLPVNVDPLKSELKNEEERARLAHVFEQGLGQDRRLRLAGEAPGRIDWQRLDERPLVSPLASISSSFPAIRRSATGCRSTRCRGPHLRTPTRSSRPIPSSASTRCRGASSRSALRRAWARHRARPRRRSRRWRRSHRHAANPPPA